MIQQKAMDRRRAIKGSQPWGLNAKSETNFPPISYCFLRKLEGYE